MAAEITLSKTGYKKYLEAPLHLWAYKHDRVEIATSPLKSLMGRQGFIVEKVAKRYLETVVLPLVPESDLIWQKEFNDKFFTIRADALIYKPGSQSFDLYEIKSGTSVKKDYIVDAAFQYHVLSQQIQVERVFILHLKKEYIRRGELDIEQLFEAEDVTEKVNEKLGSIVSALPDALATARAVSPEGIAHCYKPKDCPCPSLCHPLLPDKSIYDIPGLRENKKKLLLGMGVLKIKDVPDDFKLSERQHQVVDVIKAGKSYIDQTAIAQEFQQFTYPLYFLDYESCISALPLFDGYHSQQQIVFQYSLHRIDSPGAKLIHTDFLRLKNHDTTGELLKQLSLEIGPVGNVFVWNKTFEMTRHKEMAVMHPEYASFLENVNARVYDIGDFIKNGWYLDPGFKGRWSIKCVLPIMVPDLNYQVLEINNGEMASAAWWEITQDGKNQTKIDTFMKALKEYCKLDTLAMVRIFEKLSELI